MTNHHADCAQCCQIGRCHFCGAIGPVAAAFEKDGQRYDLRLCPTHYSWAASSKHAPVIVADGAVWAEAPSEPVRKSEHFQSTVLALSTR